MRSCQEGFPPPRFPTVVVRPGAVYGAVPLRSWVADRLVRYVPRSRLNGRERR